VGTLIRYNAWCSAGTCQMTRLQSVLIPYRCCLCRCQSPGVDRTIQKRNLFDNASNFLSNLLVGGNLKNMPVAKGACYHWSVRPAPVLLALSGVAYYCSCSALFCLLEAWISCSLWILDTLMDMISEWKLCCFHIQHYFDHMNLPTPPYVFQTCHCLCMMGSLVTDVFCIGSWKRNV
jgi:hypothetical protein